MKKLQRLIAVCAVVSWLSLSAASAADELEEYRKNYVGGLRATPIKIDQ